MEWGSKCISLISRHNISRALYNVDNTVEEKSLSNIYILHAAEREGREGRGGRCGVLQHVMPWRCWIVILHAGNFISFRYVSSFEELELFRKREDQSTSATKLHHFRGRGHLFSFIEEQLIILFCLFCVYLAFSKFLLLLNNINKKLAMSRVLRRAV